MLFPGIYQDRNTGTYSISDEVLGSRFECTLLDFRWQRVFVDMGRGNDGHTQCFAIGHDFDNMRPSPLSRNRKSDACASCKYKDPVQGKQLHCSQLPRLVVGCINDNQAGEVYLFVPFADSWSPWNRILTECEKRGTSPLLHRIEVKAVHPHKGIRGHSKFRLGRSLTDDERELAKSKYDEATDLMDTHKFRFVRKPSLQVRDQGPGGHYEQLDELRVAEASLREAEASREAIVRTRGRQWYDALIKRREKRINAIKDEMGVLDQQEEP